MYERLLPLSLISGQQKFVSFVTNDKYSAYQPTNVFNFLREERRRSGKNNSEIKRQYNSIKAKHHKGRIRMRDAVSGTFFSFLPLSFFPLF